MRLAVFTSQFPTRVNTFFVRDIAALVRQGFEIDIYPLYPKDESLGTYLPTSFRDDVGTQVRVRYPFETLRAAGAYAFRSLAAALGNLELLRPVRDALKYGPTQAAKTLFAVTTGIRWGKWDYEQYDYVLSYWGNYCATAAHTYVECLEKSVPLGIILHAGVDLYRERIFMEEKLTKATDVFVVCQFNREFLKQNYPDIYPDIRHKIKVHHLGLNLESYAKQDTSRQSSTIIAVGRLVEEKGFHYLIKAVARVIREGSVTALKIVGDGPFEGSLRRLAKETGIEDRVEFTGWVSPDKVGDLIGQAAVLVHPSTGLGDAVPTVIKEAMAAGTAVIGTEVAGIPELLDYGRVGKLVPPKDEHALAKAIADVLSHPDRLEEYAVAGRCFARKTFDINATSQELANVIRQSVKAVKNRQSQALSTDRVFEKDA